MKIARLIRQALWICERYETNKKSFSITQPPWPKSFVFGGIIIAKHRGTAMRINNILLK